MSDVLPINLRSLEALLFPTPFSQHWILNVADLKNDRIYQINTGGGGEHGIGIPPGQLAAAGGTRHSYLVSGLLAFSPPRNFHVRLWNRNYGSHGYDCQGRGSPLQGCYSVEEKTGMRGRAFTILIYADLDLPPNPALLTYGILDLFTSLLGMQGTGAMTYGRARPDDLPQSKALTDTESLGGLRVINATSGLTEMEEIAHVHPDTVLEPTHHRSQPWDSHREWVQGFPAAGWIPSGCPSAGPHPRVDQL